MTALVVVAGCADGAPADAQQIHPGKSHFSDAASWPSVAPGDVPLRGFHPFRAVYERVYQDAEGDEVRDHIIVTAERVAWGETPAVMVTLIDSGSRDHDDTWARIQTRVISEKDQSLLMQIAPAPGTARDYVIGHTDGGARATLVQAESGAAQSLPVDFPLPQLGAPGLWLAASMNLEEGQRLAFSQADAPAPSSTLGARPYHVVGQEEFLAGPVGQVEAWVVEYPLGMTNGRMMRAFVIDRPPYLVGKRPLDLDSGETTELGTQRLVAFTALGPS